MRRFFSFLVLLLSTGLAAQAQSPSDTLDRELRFRLQQSKPDTGRVSLLQQLAHDYFYRPGRRSVDTDSALLFARSAACLSIDLVYGRGLADSYQLLARIKQANNEPETGMAFADQAVTLYGEGGCFHELGETLFFRASFYPLSGNEMDKRIAYVQKALAAFRQAGEREKEGNCYQELADLYQFQEHYFQSLNCLETALKIYQEIKYPGLQGVYNLMGQVSVGMGDLKNAVRYGVLAIRTAEKLKDTTMQLCALCNHLGISYFWDKQYDSSLVWFDRALRIAGKYEDHPALFMLSTNYANSLMELGRAAETIDFLGKMLKDYPDIDFDRRIVTQTALMNAHNFLHQNEKAGEYCRQLLNLLEKHPGLEDHSKLRIYQNVLYFFVDTRQYPSALKYIDIYHSLAIKTGSLHHLSFIEKNLFQMDSARGLYQPAILHYQQYKKLEDSIAAQAKSKQIELQIHFETEKRDQDILLKEQNIALLTKQAQLQKTQLHEAGLLRNVILAGIAGLFLITGLLYNRYRLKQSQQRVINDKNKSLERLLNEKEWLLKEIHHRVKNNLQIVMSLLNVQSAYLQDDSAVTAIQDSQRRVQSISLIHKKLYQTDNVAAINMRPYIHELVDYLRDCFSTSQHIRYELDIAAIELDVAQAVPIGLMLNEAITNAIKYAFPENREGIISIVFRKTAAGDLLLSIADNGVGLPEHFDAGKSNSLGMNLIQGLSDDIEARFTVKNRGEDPATGKNTPPISGTLLTIRFFPEQPAEMIHQKETASL